MARHLSKSWPTFGKPLADIAQQASTSIMNVARSSVFAILASMHREKLTSPSPYVKELCTYLRTFQLHTSSFLSVSDAEKVLSAFIDYIIELFLLNSSLMRPLSSDILACLSSDLQYIGKVGLNRFQVSSPLLSKIPHFAQAFSLSSVELSNCDGLPFWFVVHLLISLSEESLLSPHVSAGWTLTEYLKWFLEHTTADRLNFLFSLMQSYTSSVVSRGYTEYVENYPLIMNVLQKVTVKI